MHYTIKKHYNAIKQAKQCYLSVYFGMLYYKHKIRIAGATFCEIVGEYQGRDKILFVPDSIKFAKRNL